MEPYVALTLVAALLFAGGNALQKHGIASRLAPFSLSELARGPHRIVARLARNPVWMLGTGVTVVAVALETQALGLGDLSVVKPLSRVQTLFVLMIGVLILRERIAPMEWAGIGVMVLGAALLGAEPGDAVVYAPTTAASLAVAAATGSFVALGLFLAASGRLPLRLEPGLALASGVLFGLGDVMMKLGTEVVRGRIGAFDFSNASTLPALVVTPEFQVSMAAAAAAFLAQQVAFSRGRVSLVVPLIGATATLLAVLLGFALLREPLGAARLAGISIVVAGAALTGSRGEPGARTAAVA